MGCARRMLCETVLNGGERFLGDKSGRIVNSIGAKEKNADDISTL